ncbi:MAG TPA: hypothetical protein VN794_22320 [Methylomirabilota bacterium]|nr:hypothetical protein [Methylomirabilota bacterium]
MGRRFLRVFALCCCLSCSPAVAETGQLSSAARAASRDEFGYDPTDDFVAFDPAYRVKHARYVEQLQTLQVELARQAAAGRATPCSRQVFLEARWLVYYSAHWDRIERRLRELGDLLARPADPPGARDQVEADGSYDICSEAWFLKLDSTIEEVEDRIERGERPRFPLKLLDRINDPEKLRAYLDSLLVSDVRQTGIDNRFELNIAITAIERFIVGHVGKVYDFAPGLKQTLFDYQDHVWQDPVTGYFGGWYRLGDGTIRKTADLSVTFHIVSYRRDNIKRLPEIARTTLAIKDREYPFGWLEEGRPSNHHNYDVVRLLRVGWPAMDEGQKEFARAQFRKMLDFCLVETLNPDGSFKMMDEDTLGSSFLFPVSLLNELGYFRPSLRFWTWDSFPEAMEVAGRVEHRIRSMGLTDTESAKVLRRFAEARSERRAWWAGGLLLLGAAGVGAWRLGRRFRRNRPSKPG